MANGMPGLSWRTAVAAGCSIIMALAGGCQRVEPAARAERAQAEVTIRVGDVLERRFVGLGVDFGPYPITIGEDDWARNFARLDVMRPGLIRVMITASVYTDGFRADGTPIYRWDKPKMRQLRRILDWAQRRDVTVVLGEWTLPLPGEPGANTWATRIATFVRHLRALGYTTIRYYNLINEPDRNGWTSACAATARATQSPPPPVWKARWRCWRDAVTTLRTALDTSGRSPIGLVGPDTTEWLRWHPGDARQCPPARPAAAPSGPPAQNGTPAQNGAPAQNGVPAPNGIPAQSGPAGGVPDCWLRRTADRMADQIALYDVHRYSTVASVESGALELQMRELRRHVTAGPGAAVPFVLGEAGIADPDGDENQQLRFDFRYGVWMADYLVQTIRAGQAGAVAWSLDDALHGADAVDPQGGYGSRHLKGWGFWNSLAGEYGYPTSDRDPRPWFYSWAVLSRAFPAGAQTLAVPATGVDGLRVAAARVGRPGVSLAVVNDADRPAAVTIRMAGTTVRELAEYRYFADRRPVDAAGMPVSRRRSGVDLGRGLRVTLPGRGLVVLTSAG